MGKRSGWFSGQLGDAEVVQRLEHRRAVPPGHSGAARRDVVAVLGGDGDEELGLDADGLEPGAVFGLDLVEAACAVVRQVHLVDEHGDLADAQQVQQVAVAAGVLLDAFVGVDQQQRGFGVGGAGDHVLEELLVAGRVDDDVLAFGRLEPDLRGVDGDVLVALGLEGVHEVGPLEGHAAALGDLSGAARACRRAASRCHETAGRQRWTCRGPRGRR